MVVMRLDSQKSVPTGTCRHWLRQVSFIQCQHDQMRGDEKKISKVPVNVLFRGTDKDSAMP